MGHMATRGKAMEFGLRKRSDRWGVLEKGLVQAEVPISAPDRILIRIVEYEVKKLVKSKNTVLSDVGVLSTDKLNESLSSQIAEALTASGFDPLIPVSRDYSGVSTRDHPRTNLAGSMLSIITTSSNDSPERHSPVREISSEEVGEKKNLRLLLYRSMSTTEDYSTLVGRALSKAKVDLQLGTTEGSTEVGGVGCMSARGLIHSARKDSARGYSRGTDSSRAISVSIAAAAALLLSTTIHVKCTTKDVEETSPLDPKNILSSELQEMKKIQPVIEYDFNGHVCSSSSPEGKKSYPRKGIKDIPKENKISGFSSTYEEGGSVTDLFNSLVKSFIAHLTPNPGIPRKSDIDGGRIYSQSTLKTAPTTTSNSTSDMFLGNVQPKVREVNLVIDITGKWLQETVTEVTKMGTGTGTSADNYGNKKMLRPESRNISQDPHDNNSEEEEAGVGAVSPTMSARSAGISASDPVDLPIPIQKPIMSIRKLLRTAREFSTAEKGESYLYSRKMKMMEKERTSKVAIEGRNKLDSQTAVFTAKRRKIVLQFTVTSTDDIQALSDKVFLLLFVNQVKIFHL